MTVYVCQDCLDSILCGVYDAWTSKKGHGNVRLEIAGERDPELFCVYEEVEISAEKTERVIDSIRKKISEEAFELVYRVSLSQQTNRADAIYRFLIYGFHYGKTVITMLQLPAVYEVFQMDRNIYHEEHHLMGFTRFSRMEQGILLGKIRPKNNILPLLAVHFTDRLSKEHWILYDMERKTAAVHQAGKGWILVEAGSEQWQEKLNRATDEAQYEELWKAFHQHIAIKERENPRCQRNFLPMRFRPYMTEFQDTV